jgi:archaeosine synthase
VTKYFEVLRRDGPARLGRLTLEKTIDTPGIISREDYVSAGSIFEFRSLEEAVDASSRHSEEKEKMVVPHMSHQLCTLSLRALPQAWRPEAQKAS